MSVVILSLLAGCMGADEDTLVDELRVMAVIVEPPEAAPGVTVAITAYIADPAPDPDGAAPEVLLWTCTNLGDGCLEATEPGQGTTVGAPTDGQLVTTRIVPPALAGVVGDGTTVLPLLLWTLACAPELCPAIDRAAAAPDTADADTLAAFLADPITGAEDLPLVGTSLALAQLSVSTRAAQLTNPVLTPPSELPSVDVGGSVDVTFTVDRAGTAYGYTTRGGFDATGYDIVDGTVTLTWFGGDEAGTADLWVVVNGIEGGSVVWRGVGTVE